MAGTLVRRNANMSILEKLDKLEKVTDNFSIIEDVSKWEWLGGVILSFLGAYTISITHSSIAWVFLSAFITAIVVFTSAIIRKYHGT